MKPATKQLGEKAIIPMIWVWFFGVLSILPWVLEGCYWMYCLAGAFEMLRWWIRVRHNPP